jgi:hypothetical protein
MAENKCGWCRESGHQKRKCKEFHTLRSYVWNTTILNRKAVVREMASSGVGNGAIIQVAEWNKKSNFLVLDPSERINSWQIFQFKNIKYSKQVRVSESYRQDEYGEILRIPLLNLATSTACSLGFYEHYLRNGGYKTGYEGYGSFRLLSPSNDECEIADSVYEENILINKRLAVPEEAARTNWNPAMLKSCIVDINRL